MPSRVDGSIVVSNEVYCLRWKENDHLSFDDRHAIIPLLRDASFTEAIMLKSTGSSSSRARVAPEAVADLPVPLDYFSRPDLASIAQTMRDAADAYWDAVAAMNEASGTG